MNVSILVPPLLGRLENTNLNVHIENGRHRRVWFDSEHWKRFNEIRIVRQQFWISGNFFLLCHLLNEKSFLSFWRRFVCSLSWSSFALLLVNVVLVAYCPMGSGQFNCQLLNDLHSFRWWFWPLNIPSSASIEISCIFRRNLMRIQNPEIGKWNLKSILY